MDLNRDSLIQPILHRSSLNSNNQGSISRYVTSLPKNIAGSVGGSVECDISGNFAAQRAAPVFQMENEGGVK